MSDVGELFPKKGIQPIYLNMTVFEVLTALSGWEILDAKQSTSSFGTRFSNGTIDLEIDFYLIDNERSAPKIMCIRSNNCTVNGRIPCNTLNIVQFEAKMDVKLEVTEDYKIHGERVVYAENGSLHIREEGGRISEVSVYDTAD